MTTCTPSPGSALRYAASVDISVLPSPVRISAMRPSFSVRPPMSCTSKWRILSVRCAASRTTAKASGAMSIERLAVGQALAEFVGLGAQRFVAQGLQGVLEGSRLAHRRLIAADDAIVATAEESRQKIEHLRILARKIRPENCNVVSDLGRCAAGPGRYSTDRPERTVLVSARDRRRRFSGPSGGSASRARIESPARRGADMPGKPAPAAVYRSIGRCGR